MRKIYVVGSINRDLVVFVKRLPRPGETIFGDRFQQFPGGKGANQAVAASRLGGHVHLVGNVGADAFGTEMNACHAAIRCRIVVLKTRRHADDLALNVGSYRDKTIRLIAAADEFIKGADTRDIER